MKYYWNILLSIFQMKLASYINFCLYKTHHLTNEVCSLLHFVLKITKLKTKAIGLYSNIKVYKIWSVLKSFTLSRFLVWRALSSGKLMLHISLNNLRWHTLPSLPCPFLFHIIAFDLLFVCYMDKTYLKTLIKLLIKIHRISTHMHII